MMKKIKAEEEAAKAAAEAAEEEEEEQAQVRPKYLCPKLQYFEDFATHYRNPDSFKSTQNPIHSLSESVNHL